MVKPLTFKGDKKPKKRKRNTVDDDGGNDTQTANPSKALTTTHANVQDNEDDTTWVAADIVSDISGPIIIVLPSTTPTFLATDAHGVVFPSEVENMIEADPATAEPHDVRQVWVANRIVGQEAYSLRGHHGKYLGCDRVGTVGAVKEAVGPEESFVVVPAPDMVGAFCLQTVRERFVTVEEKEDEKRGTQKVEIRGDEENVGFNTTFRIRMQARFKPKLKANKEEKSFQKISRKELEAAVGRDLEDEEVKTLKRARREGNYHEVLLDVKVKGKHDKFA